MIARPAPPLGIPKMFAHLAVGEVLWGDADVYRECHGCHPGLSEVFVATASRFAFIAHRFMLVAAEKEFRESLPPSH
jgi:hypothetical protein